MSFQLLCICYNSAECIYETLSSWIPYVSCINILVNDGYLCDESQIQSTLREIERLAKLSVVLNIHVLPFKGFSETRNQLIELSQSKYTWSIFIDDSYVLKNPKEFPKGLDPKNEAYEITIERQSVSYQSVRIFKTESNLRYSGNIHETLNTNLRVRSGIIVEDKVYKSHIHRTNNRQYYDLKMLESDKSPRGLYHKACTLINLYSQGLVPKRLALEAIHIRLKYPGPNDPQETFLLSRYLEELEKKVL